MRAIEDQTSGGAPDGARLHVGLEAREVRLRREPALPQVTRLNPPSTHQQHASVGVLSAHRRESPGAAIPARLGSVAHASLDALILLDGDLRQLDANQAACRLFGLSQAQLLGCRFDEFIAAAAGEPVLGQWQALLRDGGDRPRCELLREDGSRVTIEVVAAEELCPGAHVCLIRDATESDVASPLPDGSRSIPPDAPPVAEFGSWDWDLATDTIEWSDQAHQIFGVEPGRLTKWAHALERVHPDDRAMLDAALQGRQSFSSEYRVLRPNRAVRVIESHGEILLDAEGRPARVRGTVQDITPRRQAEIDRRNLAAVLDTSDDAITTSTLDGIFLSWNRGAELLYGYTAQEAIGQSLDLITPPGERATDHLNWERLLNDEPVRSLETVRETKDGRTVIVSVTRSLIIDAGGSVVGVASVGRDITATKRTQALLAAAHAEAVAASEMKSRFLANMSHEIRTPMNGVLGMTELLLDTELSDEQRELAAQVARSGEDMMGIINDILDVSKIEAGRLEIDACDFTIRETIEQACAVGQLEAATKGVAVELEIAEDVPLRAHGDDRRLRQVLRNLVANAVKFTGEGAVIVRADAHATAGGGGTRVRIEVSDTGIG
ncbi:MAG TPA: PAS domain S-box protein, partial [Solirubrobacteraceae bacterium]|nr:PAS domain S-box protein [Solirubrobacteraceae bacterium]